MNQDLIPVSVIILTLNAKKTLKRAIDSVRFCQEIIVIDDHSSDNTIELAQQLGARVITTNGKNFSQKRNEGLRAAEHAWVFYLDADEEVTIELRDAIRDIVRINLPGCYLVTRNNYFLGKKMYQDIIERLFHKTILRGWEGEVHEHPILTAPPKVIKSTIQHFTHTSITSMLTKTNNWSEIEAELRIKANHPIVQWWRLWRIALTVWWDQLVHKKVFRYGREGWFEGYFQMIDKLIVYTKLWEKQLHEKK